MFKPTSAKDRINYGGVLMPPVGFRLERAVGTTYSLDLETLTAVIDRRHRQRTDQQSNKYVECSSEDFGQNRCVL